MARASLVLCLPQMNNTPTDTSKGKPTAFLLTIFIVTPHSTNNMALHCSRIAVQLHTFSP